LFPDCLSIGFIVIGIEVLPGKEIGGIFLQITQIKADSSV